MDLFETNCIQMNMLLCRVRVELGPLKSYSGKIIIFISSHYQCQSNFRSTHAYLCARQCEKYINEQVNKLDQC